MNPPTPVFNSDDLPKRMLRVTHTLPANVKDVGAQMQYARQDILRRIADVIAKDDRFVKLVPSDGMFVHLNADFVVLTTDEYAELCREKFREGMQHATRFMP